MNLEFAWPLLLLALPLPLLVLWLLPRAPEPGGGALRLPFYHALHASVGEGQAPRSRSRLLLATLAWVLLVTAAARPQSLGEPVQLPISGRDLLLAVDISGSMETEDMVLGNQVASRLAAVKYVVGDFIERRQGDRLGLILFGDQAYLQTPLTFDNKTVGRLLRESALGLAGERTAIGDAIGLAIKRLDLESDNSRVLVLMTDGANTAGEIDPMKAAELAAQVGLRIYTIGIGAEQMEVASIIGGRRRVNPSADLDEATLTGIADLTGGRYFRATDTATLQDIYRLVDELEPVEEPEAGFRPVQSLYFWPLSGAFVLAAFLCIVSLLQALRLRRISGVQTHAG